MTAIKGRQTHNLFSALNWAFHAPKDAIFIFFLGHRPRKFGRSGSTRMAAVFLSRGKIKKRKRVELYYGRKLEIDTKFDSFSKAAFAYFGRLRTRHGKGGTYFYKLIGVDCGT